MDLKIKSFLTLLFIVAVVLAGLFYLFGSESPETYRFTGKNVIAFGDSLVEGVGASAEGDFAALLSQRLGVAIINAGRSGDTTASALLRLEQDVLSRGPKIVIVLLGGNDALKRIPVEETFQNLEEIIDRVQGKRAGVILIGVRGGIFRDKYRKAFRDLAEEKNASFVPDILDGVMGKAGLMYDHIHPNDKGYAVMADRIEPVLREMLK